MSAHGRHIRSHVMDLAAAALIAAGVAACIYGTRYKEQGRIEEMAEFPVDELLLDKHRALAGNTAATTAEMTPEEVLAASMACQRDAASVRDDVCRQLRLHELALLIASACLLAALPTFVWSRIRWKRRPSPVAESVPRGDVEGHAGTTADIVSPPG